MPGRLSRRQLLQSGLAIAAGAAASGVGSAVTARPVAAGPLPGPGRTSALLPSVAPEIAPVTMAMHLHSSFSEGIASMDAHLYQARRTGVDVVWWTDHDFRVRALGHRKAVHFDGPVENEDGFAWSWSQVVSGPVGNAVVEHVDDPRSPDEPGRAMRLFAVGSGDEWGRLHVEGVAYNTTYSTTIADTVLELDVLAEELGPDAELVVEIVSSHRPPTAGRPAGQYLLQYRVGDQEGHSLELDPRIGVVAIRRSEGWQRLRLDPVSDVTRLWPDLVPGDASLWRFRIAVRARAHARVSAVVDRLRFLRSRRTEPEAIAMQRELMAAYALRYPDVVQHLGAELSQTQHLNRFGGSPFLPAFSNVGMRKDPSIPAALAMVEQVHQRGGIVSYNHPLADTGSALALARVLVETNNLGAELIEVGCGAVEDVTWAYDVAARNAVFATATGVSDDHRGRDWLLEKPPWITTAWSPSTDEGDLVAALAAGRAWFSHLPSYGGTMEITSGGMPAMGSVIVTDDLRVPLEVLTKDLPADSTLEVVVGEVDRAGTSQLEPAITTTRIPASEVGNAGYALDLDRGAGRYLRAVVRDQAEAVVGFSNPVWVLPEQHAADVPAERTL